MNETNKFMAKYTNPTFILKQLFNFLSNCKTHCEVLNTFDIIQIVLAILNEEGLQLVLSSEILSASSSKNLIVDEYDVEFYKKNELAYYMSHQKCDWHLAINRFVNITPSTRSRLDHVVFASVFRILARLLAIQTKLLNISKSCINTNQELTILNDLLNKSAHIERNDEQNQISIGFWLLNMLYSPSSSLLNMMKSFFSNFENNTPELRYV